MSAPWATFLLLMGVVVVGTTLVMLYDPIERWVLRRLEREG